MVKSEISSKKDGSQWEEIQGRWLISDEKFYLINIIMKKLICQEYYNEIR